MRAPSAICDLSDGAGTARGDGARDAATRSTSGGVRVVAAAPDGVLGSLMASGNCRSVLVDPAADRIGQPVGTRFEDRSRISFAMTPRGERAEPGAKIAGLGALMAEPGREHRQTGAWHLDVDADAGEPRDRSSRRTRSRSSPSARVAASARP